jgi:hypothetical protein
MRELWWLLRYLLVGWWQTYVVAAPDPERQVPAWLHRLQEPAPLPGARRLTVDELLAECGLTREVQV